MPYRPHKPRTLRELSNIAHENWGNLHELQKISDEISERLQPRSRSVSDYLQLQIDIGRQMEFLQRQQRKRAAAEEAQQAERDEAERKRQWEQYRREGYFPWPSTDAPASGPGGGFRGEKPWYTDGLLSYVGYKVGNDGVRQQIRERILDCVFHNNLPRVRGDGFGVERYMSEWGDKQTPQRLKKMANCIATFARNAKRRVDHDMSEAISNWKVDLDYLYRTYYVGEFHFDWPEISL